MQPLLEEPDGPRILDWSLCHHQADFGRGTKEIHRQSRCETQEDCEDGLELGGGERFDKDVFYQLVLVIV